MEGKLAVVDVVISERYLMFRPSGFDRSLFSSSTEQSISYFVFPREFRRKAAMGAISIVPNLPHPIGCKSILRSNEISKTLYPGTRHRSGSRRKTIISAVDEVSVITSGPVTPQITWQIVVGSIAGVTPFVVAGIEFSKRIVAQKKCAECGGSGLVLIEKEYIRCPNCGGFLPWQSWKRFFTG